jgi:hypothetical protein
MTPCHLALAGEKLSGIGTKRRPKSEKGKPSTKCCKLIGPIPIRALSNPGLFQLFQRVQSAERYMLVLNIAEVHAEFATSRRLASAETLNVVILACVSVCQEAEQWLDVDVLCEDGRP